MLYLPWGSSEGDRGSVRRQKQVIRMIFMSAKLRFALAVVVSVVDPYQEKAR